MLAHFLQNLCKAIVFVVENLGSHQKVNAFIEFSLEMLDVPFDRKASRHART